MGMEQAITFPMGTTVSWPAVRDLLVLRGFPVQVRMIDGELSFPDEEPTESWRELRVGTTDGALITARRDQNRLVLIVWGNADAGLVQAWNAVAWAFAHVGGGSIQSDRGTQSAQDYYRRADLPDALRRSSKEEK